MPPIKRLSFAAIVLAFLFSFVIVAPTQASAQVIKDAVTGVKIVQDSVENSSSTLTVRVDFSVGPGIGHGGTVRTGDSFWVDFAPDLGALPGTFPVYAPGTSNVVARITVAPSPLDPSAMRATFVLTNYAESRTSTTGWAQWNINFADTHAAPGDKVVTFTTESDVFRDSVTVESQTPTGGISLGTTPGKQGFWSDAGQQSMRWQVYGGIGPVDRLVISDYAPSDAFGSALWEFDCSIPFGGYYSNVPNSVTSELIIDPSSTCSPEEVNVVILNTPADMIPIVYLWAKVTDTRPQGSLVFANTATVSHTIAGTTTESDTNNATATQTFSASATGPTVPVPPHITQSVCTGPAEASTPEVELPPNGSGVSYALSGEVAAGKTVSVVATLDDGFSWQSTLPSGWVLNPANNTAVYAVTLSQPDCSVSTTPALPSVTQVTCAAPGQTTGLPGVLPPANGNGVTYSVTGNPAVGATVTVVATLDAGRVWATKLPSGWVVEPSDGTAHYAVTFNNPDCIERTTLLSPTVEQAHCTGPGDASDPSVALPQSRDGITYTTSKAAPVAGDSVTVTATLATGYAWSTPLPSGWVLSSNPKVATYAVTLSVPDCIETSTPSAPQVQNAVCTGPGESSVPQVTTGDGSAEGISYTKSPAGPYEPGQTVTVTATLDHGYAWPTTLPTGWSAGGSVGEIRYSVTLANIDCDQPDNLVAPTVTQTVCSAPGAQTPPQVNLPKHHVGISYEIEGEVVAGGTVYVVATLDQGYTFNTPFPTGWTADGANQARYEVVLQNPDCTETSTPVTPATSQVVCTAPGDQSPAKLSIPQNRNGIVYTIASGEVKAGQTVVLQATLQPGYAFPATLPENWVQDAQNAKVATYSTTFDNPDCTERTSPRTPAAVQSVCLGPGDSKAPEITLPADEDGVSYTITPTAYKPGDTVTITAQLAYGYEWESPLPSNWQSSANGKSATLMITLAEPDCILSVSTLSPEVIQAQCTAPGVWQAPTVTPAADSTGIEYEITPSGALKPGEDVSVIARLAFGYRWAKTLPNGWSLDTASGDAVYRISLADIDCTSYLAPSSPEVTQAVCTGPGDESTPTVIVATVPTAGVSYQTVGKVAAGQNVTVVASLDAGYGWKSLPTGWSLNDATGNAEFTVKLAKLDCLSSVAPTKPEVTQQACQLSGKPTQPSLSVPPNTAGITYQQRGDVVAGKNARIVGALNSGYSWQRPLPTGWSLDGEDAVFTVAFKRVACADNEISTTGIGGSSTGALWVAAPLILLGTAAVYYGLRNRKLRR